MLSISIAAVIIYLTYEATKYRNRKIEELNEREIMEIKNEIATEKREPLKMKKYTDEQLESVSEIANIETVKNRETFRNFKMEKLDKDMESVKQRYLEGTKLELRITKNALEDHAKELDRRGKKIESLYALINTKNKHINHVAEQRDLLKDIIESGIVHYEKISSKDKLKSKTGVDISKFYQNKTVNKTEKTITNSNSRTLSK